ncbi:hypothetical protein O6H91_10G046100 [Diphasiastrum complanatum]|uniref:Uncharacterized protein n=1 Tax=Diphasiastrum complanatum TaxID=34168 RepID=A0ACC2CGP6_DIPCM|nr:hypothetical protein O6H91_10G046100 [Diphasiastrum complanatum]
MGEIDRASPEVLKELEALRKANAELLSEISALQKQFQGTAEISSKPICIDGPNATLEHNTKFFSQTQHNLYGSSSVQERVAPSGAKLEVGSKARAGINEETPNSQGTSVTHLENDWIYEDMGGCKRKSMGNCKRLHNLDPYTISRYSRQLLVPAFGVKGQENLLKSSILIVGAGGLGSPAALYLAAAGVGCLGLVDHDVVELDNLHRQVIHTEGAVGETKVKSAAAACRAINSFLKVDEHCSGLQASNALDIISKYDIIVDATDNLPTRYLINDACVVMGKPLVSGAALGTEGQLTVYHHGDGPCYRCIFPVPPPTDACQSCSDAGVLGVVPGIIGCLQALEAIKLASGTGEPLSSRLLILDALTTSVQKVKLRGRNHSCIVCGDAPQISRGNLHQFDYEAFTNSLMSDKIPQRKQILPLSHGVSCKEYNRRCEEGELHVLLDVRDTHQYAISALPNSVNVPFSQLKETVSQIQDLAKGIDLEVKEDYLTEVLAQSPRPIYVICRRGHDSQKTVQFLRSNGFPDTFDIIGGLESWTREVDHHFPKY